LICPLRRRIEEKSRFLLTRVFPGKGTAAVKVGQSVSATDVIAHCEVSAGQRLIKVAHSLGIPSDQVGAYLTRKIGDRIYQGEVLARRKSFFGLGRTEIKAPVDGVVSEIDDRGDIILKFLPTRVRLIATANGEITEISTGKIVIKAVVTKIRGFVAQGADREGMILMVAGPKDFILPSSIKPEVAGRILVGGALLERGALEKAVTIGAKGVVTGGVHYRDFEGLSSGGDIGISLMVTEGFGISPMGEDIWNFCKKMEGRSSFIHGGERQLIVPEIEKTVDVKEVSEVTWRNLQVGDKVRFFQGEAGNLLGVVEGLPGEQILNSGVLTEVAQISFKEGEQLTLPAANLEIIE